jgi:hypothetical protein
MCHIQPFSLAVDKVVKESLDVGCTHHRIASQLNVVGHLDYKPIFASLTASMGQGHRSDKTRLSSSLPSHVFEDPNHHFEMCAK